MVLARWGLVPFFTKELSDVKGLSTINARAETITTSKTYRLPDRQSWSNEPSSETRESCQTRGVGSVEQQSNHSLGSPVRR
ncbi:MAG: SOS response-associated peptidase [Acidobacteriota bacterium]|nr:SOS response-associated peptidase [Acidobacteriota bacterium]